MDLEAFLSEMFLDERCDVLPVQGIYIPFVVLVFRFQDLYKSVEGRDL